ncbi:hypothetical protein BC830DRAFT_39159 [Chytriomyces sp. MP71]|nr:hypothetical protein BC830DRAFT_39159 [Chytriomyces sp. MP71]
MLQEDPFEFDDDDVELDDAALAQIDALSSLNAMSAPLLPFGVFRETQLPPSANGGFCRQNQPSPSVGVVRDSFSQSQLAAASTQVHAQFQRPQTFVGSLLPALTSSTRQSQDLGEGGLSLAYKKQLDELAAENMRLKKEFDEKVGETFALRMRVDEIRKYAPSKPRRQLIRPVSSKRKKH